MSDFRYTYIARGASYSRLWQAGRHLTFSLLSRETVRRKAALGTSTAGGGFRRDSRLGTSCSRRQRKVSLRPLSGAGQLGAGCGFETSGAPNWSSSAAPGDLETRHNGRWRGRRQLSGWGPVVTLPSHSCMTVKCFVCGVERRAIFIKAYQTNRAYFFKRPIVPPRRQWVSE